MFKRKMSVVYLIATLCIFFNFYNSTEVKAETLTQTNQTFTTYGNAQSNGTVTVTGSSINLYAGTYYVSTVDEFKQQLKAAISNCADSITLSYTGSTAFTGFPSSLSSMIGQITQTAGNDYEKLLLKSWSYTYSYPINNAFTITYKFTYWETANQRQQVSDQVNTILASIITPGMTDEQKEKAINAYICANVSYDTTLVQHSAYAALFGNKRTVCQGYALLAYRMLTAAGLEARTVVGSANGVGHAWNMVKINDENGQNPKWYDLDVTWNDPIPDVAGRVRYSYFNLQDSRMISSAHRWNAAYYPVANSPYITTDQQIIDGGRKSDIVTSSPNSSDVTIVNNVIFADKITVTNVKTGDVVRIYKDSSATTALASVTVPLGQTSASINVAQLGQASGSIYVTVKNVGAFESSRTSVDYSAEAISDVPAATITNNVDKADSITFTGVKVKDVATVYAKDGITVLGRGTALADGNLTFNLTRQLSETDLEVKSTIKSYNELVSPVAAVTYSKQEVSAAPSATIVNNVDKADSITFTGLKAKDVVIVYAKNGTTILARATALADGDLTLNFPYKLSETDLEVEATIKNYNKMTSPKTPITYSKQEVTTAPLGLDVLNEDGSIQTAGDIVVTNNVDKLDTVLVKGLKAKDVVTIYGSNQTTILKRVVALVDGDLTITLPYQLDAVTRKAFITVKNYNKDTSEKRELDYAAQEVSAAPSATIVNNVDKADSITFTGLKAKDVVTVYAKNGTTVLARATALVDGDLTLNLLYKLSETDLEVEATIKNYNKMTSPKTPITYSKQEVTTAPLGLDVLNGDGSIQTAGDIVVTNNVDKLDTVLVKGLKAKDVVTIYGSNQTTVFKSVVALVDGDLTITLPYQLDETTRKAFITVKNYNKDTSTKTELDYAAQAVTATLESSNLSVTNSSITVNKLVAGDKISVYATTTDGYRLITYGTVATGYTNIVVRFTGIPSGTTLYVTRKTANQMQSAKLAVTTP
ncbi:transglutaminase domain-containing protein [Inconstantimicrobium mannanitabidum]|uniref:Uncharacterized protein n=1 Tax=Inconstantimicrobium mannanitabidum TaxID=1604901 RepID=A0ACB5RHM8_9CLOT|nr:transglutaminase domain-containing protein [Clostridium sp. TW13]GKX68572.1 hypothetical protein rsdtw13_38300 [Clostridium sp. TW13]